MDYLEEKYLRIHRMHHTKEKMNGKNYHAFAM